MDTEIKNKVNQNIKTSVGVVIIIIIAITAGAFVWMSQKDNTVSQQAPAPISVKPKGWVSFSIEKISCVADEEGAGKGVLHVYVDGNLVGNVELRTCAVVDGKVLKKTDKLAYFTIIPESSEWSGFTPFGMYENLYRLNLELKTIDAVELRGGGFISPIYFSNDAKKIAYYSPAGMSTDNIEVYELDTYDTQIYEIPPGWEGASSSPEGDGFQIGSFWFSPDNKKLAMAVDYGPKKEHGEVYILDLEKKSYKLYAEADYLIKVNGWKNSEEVDWGSFGESKDSYGIGDWQTYRNEKYKFEFKYPGNLKIDEQSLEGESGPGGIVHSIDLGNGVYVTVNEIEQGARNGEDALSEPNGMDPVSQKNVTIAGLKGRIYDDEEVFVVAKNGYQYYIGRDDQSGNDIKDLLQKIVLTFKFTN